jgi:hypothetical protein
MLNIIGEALVLVVTFVVGVAVGAHNVVSVDKAIDVVKKAEQSAQATITKITAHKVS